jgi:hypothetical protein
MDATRFYNQETNLIKDRQAWVDKMIDGITKENARDTIVQIVQAFNGPDSWRTDEYEKDGKITHRARSDIQQTKIKALTESQRQKIYDTGVVSAVNYSADLEYDDVTFTVCYVEFYLNLHNHDDMRYVTLLSSNGPLNCGQYIGYEEGCNKLIYVDQWVIDILGIERVTERLRKNNYLNVGERCFKYSGDDNPRPSKIQKLN